MCGPTHTPSLEQYQVSWYLELSDQFSTKSLYQAITALPGPEPLSQLWSVRLPSIIRIFLWQWIRGRVPSGVEVFKRNGPGDGFCPLCDTDKDSNHIFFFCVTAQFLWRCFREVVGGEWCHTNCPNLFEELQVCKVGSRHIRWIGIGVLVWTLWMIRNKLVIERTPLRHPADAIYKLCGFLQLWKPLSDRPERGAIDALTSGFRTLALCLASPLPTPPPEPD